MSLGNLSCSASLWLIGQFLCCSKEAWLGVLSRMGMFSCFQNVTILRGSVQPSPPWTMTSCSPLPVTVLHPVATSQPSSLHVASLTLAITYLLTRPRLSLPVSLERYLNLLGQLPHTVYHQQSVTQLRFSLVRCLLPPLPSSPQCQPELPETHGWGC